MLDSAAQALAGGGVMMTGVYTALLLQGVPASTDGLGWVKLLGELPLTAAMLIGIIFAAKEMRKFIADRDAKMKEVTDSFTEALGNMEDKHDATSMALVHELKSLSIQQATSIEVMRTMTMEVAAMRTAVQSCGAVQESKRILPPTV